MVCWSEWTVLPDSELVFMSNSHPFESAPFDSGGNCQNVCVLPCDLYDTSLVTKAQHAEQTMCSVNLGLRQRKTLLHIHLGIQIK